MFSGFFFRKADSYFHSGVYPTIFDNNESFQTPHLAEDSGAVEGRNEGDERGFLGRPRDWLDRFSRNFFPSYHTHLDQGGAASKSNHGHEGEHADNIREILPWIHLSARLDPSRVESYTVGAYWLRKRMKRIDEAETFLREGLQENPGSYAILFELGRLFAENHKDYNRARNLWHAALRNWAREQSDKTEPDRFLYLQLHSQLAMLEEQVEDYPASLLHWKEVQQVSPNPVHIEFRIKEVEAKLKAHGARTN